MTASDEADEHLVDHVVFALDRLAHARAQPGKNFLRLLDLTGRHEIAHAVEAAELLPRVKRSRLWSAVARHRLFGGRLDGPWRSKVPGGASSRAVESGVEPPHSILPRAAQPCSSN